MLVGDISPPEIIAGGNDCAFRWIAEKLIFAILKRKNAMQSAHLLHSIFCFSRLPGVSCKFCDISLWTTVILQTPFLIPTKIFLLFLPISFVA